MQWHTLLTQNALVVVRAKGNVQYLQSVKVTVNTLLMQSFVSTAVHVLLSVQLKHQILLNIYLNLILSGIQKKESYYSPFFQLLPFWSLECVSLSSDYLKT